MERDLKFLIGGALLTTIDGVMYESKEEIADAHRALLQATISAGLQGLIVLALVLAGIFIVFFRLIGGMVVSLVRLKEGTEIIGRGRSGPSDCHTIQRRARRAGVFLQ